MVSKTVLIMQCAWCGKPMGEKDGQGVSGVSHGMCQECYDKLTEDLDIAENMKSYWANLNSGAE